MHELPLSWAYVEGLEAIRWQAKRLPLSRLHWIHAADLPPGTDLLACWQALLAHYPKGILVRGCPPEITRALQAVGAKRFHSGVEAELVLDHDPLDKKSLRALVRRGLRWGNVHEMHPKAAGNALREVKIWAHSRHGAEPRLEGWYRIALADASRVFVFRTPAEEILACVTVTRRAVGQWHTELLLRNRHAPVGVQEATLVHIAQTLQAEGATHFSLGEVPFMGSAHAWASRFANWAGRRMRFAYNSRGLWRFKAKFEPHWRPLSLVASKRIGFFALLDLFFVGRVAHLVVYVGLVQVGLGALARALLRRHIRRLPREASAPARNPSWRG